MEETTLKTTEKPTTELKETNLKSKISKTSLILIFFTTVLMWGSGSFFYDFPQIFEPILIAEFKISTYDVSYLYTSIALASIAVMPMGGYVIAKIGLGLAALLFNFLIFIGTFVIYIGSSLNDFYYVFLGRLIFGIGCEPAFMCQNIAYEKWFSGRFLTIAYGLNRFFIYLFFVLDIYVQPKLFLKTRSLVTPIFIYGVVGALSCFTCIIYFLLEYGNEDKLEDFDHKGEKEESGKEKSHGFNFKDLKKISKLSWVLISIICIMAQVNIQMTNFVTDMLVKRYGLAYEEAEKTNMLVYSTAMILIPLFSFFLGVKGKRGLFLILAGFVCLGTVIFMIFTPFGCERWKCYLAMLGIGLYWSMYTASVWTSLMLSLPKQAVSSVISLTLTLQNTVFAILPPIFAMINKERTEDSYQNSLVLLAGIAGLSLFLTIVAYRTDLTDGRVMEMPENSREALDRRKKITEEFRASQMLSFGNKSTRKESNMSRNLLNSE